MSTAYRLLARLEGVKRAGEGRWLARCPAHDDRRPSLSIREASDGRVLVYCFAGCGAADVVAAVGLDLRDLFPPSCGTVSYSKRPRRIPASDALLLLHEETWLVEIIATRLAAGERLSDSDRRELGLAASRISVVHQRWMATR